jgi:nucleoside-diphosphate-sugar epimerase
MIYILLLGALFAHVSDAIILDPRSSLHDHLAQQELSSKIQILVTGATGRTGALVYKLLKQEGFPVRALVRNKTKAKETLSCHACDESEGIFTGDITDAESLSAPMQGVQALVILTSSMPLKADNGTYYFPEGGYPKDIDWEGSNNQLRAALEAGVNHVLLVSSMGTTVPDSFLDQLGHGHVMWYKLNGG